MPIYEYICQECEKKFDALRPMSDADAPINCSNCNGHKTKRVLSLFAAQSGGQSIAGSGGGCSGCSSGNCGSCQH